MEWNISKFLFLKFSNISYHWEVSKQYNNKRNVNSANLQLAKYRNLNSIENSLQVGYVVSKAFLYPSNMILWSCSWHNDNACTVLYTNPVKRQMRPCKEMKKEGQPVNWLNLWMLCAVEPIFWMTLIWWYLYAPA